MRAWTDFPFMAKDPSYFVPLRQVEVLSWDSEHETCKCRFETRTYVIPAAYLYRKHERYSPSHTPERCNVKGLRQEKLGRASILFKKN